MSITFLSLSEVEPADVRELLVRRVWECDWNEETAEHYFAWRFGARGSGETLVAYDRGRCIGILDSFVRPYWVNGRREIVRETCDWYCLPEYRPLGVGLHLKRRMMAKPTPIVVIGGSGDTQNLLLRLKWARLPDIDRFILGVSARTVAELLAHKRWRRGVKLARLTPDISLLRRLPPVTRPSANSQACVCVLGATQEMPTTAPYALAPILEQQVLDWLMRAPKLLGQFLVLSFFCDGEPAGISINRLQMLPSGGCCAQIVHLHAARFEVIDWMANVTVQNLIERGAGVILSRSSCPTTAGALTALGFRRRKPEPAFWWPPDKMPSPGVFHLTRLQADDALLFDVF
jgi:hypothetical protein